MGKMTWRGIGLVLVLGAGALGAKELVQLPARPNPLWFWNNAQVEEGELKKQMALFQEAGYGGLSILPFGGQFKPEYLTEAYFQRYRMCAEEAKRLGMTLWLYDEYGFPTGSAGWCNGDGRSRFAERYPELVLRRLDKREKIAKAGEQVELELGGGELMAAVAMERSTFERKNLASCCQDGKLRWTAPAAGEWRVMAFVTVKADPIMDYLDPEAARKFIELTHDQYYARMKEHFGSVIVGTFFDEPTLYRANGRVWTPKFNRRFQEQYGYSPELLYPALWYDIGSETPAARNLLFGFRTELYASAYFKAVTEWGDQRGIHTTGHQDNEEVVNPVGTSGDLMKCFKYQEMPGIDKIGGARPAELFYKVVSSAAHNWDHRLVMSETYGAMGDIEWSEIYSIAMDQYTKGVNVLIPHAVWYDVNNVAFKPELSPRHSKYAEGLPKFTAFLARLNQYLQPGRTVNDVAVMYPIASMQAGHYFDGPLNPYQGGVALPYLDYHQVARVLTDELGVDFEFLHPEVLERCPVKDGKIRLENKEQFGSFHTLVIPSGPVIALKSLEQADALLRSGGRVVFTGELPRQSTRVEDNAKVVALVADMLNRGARAIPRAPFAQELSQAIGSGSHWDNGRPARCHPATSNERHPHWDNGRPARCGDREFALEFRGPALRNLHRQSAAGDVWYFANLASDPVTTEVALRGTGATLTALDPHTGETFEPKLRRENGVTYVSLSLPPCHSLLLMANELLMANKKLMLPGR